MVSAADLLPNVHSLGFKTGQTLSKLFSFLAYLLLDAIRQLSNSNDDGDNSGDNNGNIWKTMYDSVRRFPVLYQQWWLKLVAEDPVHVAVETTLIVSLIYILFVSRSRFFSFKKKKESRSGDGSGNKLTHAEEQQLLAEWKATRGSLVPDDYDDFNDNGNDADGYAYSSSRPMQIIVHEQKGRMMRVELIENNSNVADDQIVHNTKSSNCISVHQQQPKGKMYDVLNMCTFDFWGMNSGSDSVLQGNDGDKNNNHVNGSDSTTATENETTKTTGNNQQLHHALQVQQAAHKALEKYGCGACGPRGFYGTIDAHLQLEEATAEYLGTEASILYSDGASTLSSTVAAFCKRGDLIVVDEAVSEPLKTGVILSRAHVKWFPHNDMQELRRLLEKTAHQDKLKQRKPNAQRRFLIVEGLYRNTGRICPLDELVKLKHEFAYRLILDESYSFGTLGATGKGALELYHQTIEKDAEIVTVSLENAVGTIGGVTVGTHEVVDHQRLSGAGYCFSASAPPFSAKAAIAALQILQTRTDLLQQLQENTSYFYAKLQLLCVEELSGLLLITSQVVPTISPIVFLQLNSNLPETQYLNEIVFLEEVTRECLERGLAISSTTHMNQCTSYNPFPNPRPTHPSSPISPSSHSATTTPATPNTTHTNVAVAAAGPMAIPPALRLIVTAVQTRADLDLAIKVLKESVDLVMERFREDLAEEEREEKEAAAALAATARK